MRKRLSCVAFIVLLLSILALISSCAQAAGVKTQLCLVIDGSSSVDHTQWSTITQAISEAINETIPHDGSVELTIVQFGYSSGEGFAKTELHPTIVEKVNYAEIVGQVLGMPKGDASTPTAHGLYLAWSEIKNSKSFDNGARQVINLATDGVANVRNFNATTDLDGSEGLPNAKDDVIATVNTIVNQGLDELDVEGIGMTASDIDWLKNWTVRPQPAIVAPPFTKTGWIRIVVDPNEFARTIGQKLKVTLSSNSDTWVPPAEGALAAGLLTVGVTSVISSLGSALSNPVSGFAQKINGLLPEIFKKWLQDFVSSKRKLTITQKMGHPLRLTKLEAVSYAIALSILTFAFIFAKVQSFDEILLVLPTILATSIVVEFAKNFVVEATARKMGVWTEHRLWYFGLAAFLFSTLVFRTPFSSPSRNIHYSKSFTKRSLGLVSFSSVLIGFAFAIIFGILLISGFALVGSVGLVMSLSMAFFEVLPIPPMSGKDIYNWSRPLWTALFATTLTLYMLCLLIL
jgi:Zn-dependent protease